MDIIIDTTELTIGAESPPSGVRFFAIGHDEVAGESPPELAVLQVDEMSVEVGATVTVTGDRPLVVIAAGRIQIAGTLNSSATRDEPGAGGAAPLMGPSPGGAGVSGANLQDSGGGGGANGSDGGSGGDAGVSSNCNGPRTQAADPATAVGNGIDVLRGGSGGAPGGQGNSACALGIPGAGGGAIQLTSAEAIQIDGVVNVGGGGGGGGDFCDSNDSGGGAGGGAGGMIYLEAPAITNNGMLVANGGAGGGGASGPGGDGTTGQDALVAITQAAGGMPGGQFGEPGGAGEALMNPTPLDGLSNGCEGNGGGGGGSVGWIAVDGTDDGSGEASPAAIAP